MSTAVHSKVRFMAANGSEMVLVRVHPEEIAQPKGGVRAVPGTGCRYEFQAGVLEIDPEQDVLATAEDGSEETALEWLRRHQHFGDRFVEVQPAPPPDAPVLSRILDVTLDGDLDTLEAMLVEEREGWQREPVLAALEKAIAGLKG